MRRSAVYFFIALLVSVSLEVSASGPIRIDATSEDTVNASFQAMLSHLDRRHQTELLGAIVQLNFVGVTSVYQALDKPDLQRPSVVRIKDKIAGLTADEIIELAKKTATTRVTVKAH
jgi:hypothetical protein